MELEKKYMPVFNPSDARKLMQAGNCPTDIKPNTDCDNEFLPSVFVFSGLDGRDFSVISNPASARKLLKDGFKLVDIKKNKNPKQTDTSTVFIFELTKKFREDFDFIKNLGGN